MSKSTAFLLPQTHPAFRKHDGISWILWIEANRSGKTQAAGMKIDELAQISNVLRSFVRNSGDVVVVDQKRGRVVVGARHFLHIDHGAVSDAAYAVKPFAALPLDVVGGFRLAAQQEVSRRSRPRPPPESQCRDEVESCFTRTVNAAARALPQTE